MSQGIMIFEKNKIDIDLDTYVTITVTDSVASDNGQTVVDYLRNRNNYSGWGTAGSTDAANTQLDVVFPETEITDLLLVEHNLKAYTIK